MSTTAPVRTRVGGAACRYCDPDTAQLTTPDPLYAITGSRYGYAGNDPVNGSDPTGLFCVGDLCTDGITGTLGEAWDATGGKAVTFADEHRHQIVDVGTAVGVGVGLAACGITVVCGVAVGATAITVGGLAHLGVDQISHDPTHNFSAAQAFTHSAIAAGIAEACVFGLGSTCARALISRSSLSWDAAVLMANGYATKQFADFLARSGCSDGS